MLSLTRSRLAKRIYVAIKYERSRGLRQMMIFFTRSGDHYLATTKSQTSPSKGMPMLLTIFLNFRPLFIIFVCFFVAKLHFALNNNFVKNFIEVALLCSTFKSIG